MIRLIKPYISFEEVKKEFEEVFESGLLTRGKYAEKLPQMICEYTGAKYAFNTTSATTALAMCLEVLNIGEGDEVIVSDFSFPASSNVIEACGAKPVFADVNLDTYNMNVEDVISKITERTKAVIFVCAMGNPTGIEIISEICKEKNIYLINDAACAIGSSVNEKMIGSIADFECFSFHPRKLITGGEGGMITTQHDSFAEKLKIKLSHGASINEKGQLDFVTYGYNYRLPELQCIMLLKQLEKLDDIIESRKKIVDEYISAIEPLGFIYQKYGNDVKMNFQSVVFRIPIATNRAELFDFLKGEGVEVTIGTYCLSAGSYNKEKYNDVQPNAFYLQNNTICLPCYDGLNTKIVIDAILKYNKKNEV